MKWDGRRGSSWSSSRGGTGRTRLYNLVAQSTADADGGLREGGRAANDRARNRPWEIVYFKLYQNQMPVIEWAIETAALMLGSDKSRGYCLEKICADLLVGANLDNGNPETLLFSMTGFFNSCPGSSGRHFFEGLIERASMSSNWPRLPRVRLDAASYESLRQQVSMVWRDVHSGGTPSRVPQSLGCRLGGTFDQPLFRLPRQITQLKHTRKDK